MYIPPHFEEPDTEVLLAFIGQYPLATLVTFSDHHLNANHIPLHRFDDGSEYGVLQGHVARANPLCMARHQSVEVLAVFQSENAYISPSWYATKVEHGMVVPTWNYAAVHAYGTLRLVEEASWIRQQLETLTKQHEAALAEPWSVADAPPGFIEKLITQIVGIEITLTRLVGKWKVSQNQPLENQKSVVAGLTAANKFDMAEMVAARYRS